MVPKFLFTLETDDNQSCSVYKFTDGETTIWLKIGVGVIEIGSIDQVENLIGLLRETINQAKQEK